MLLRFRPVEGPVVPNYCVNDVDQFVGDSSHRNHLGFGVALPFVEFAQDRIHILICTCFTHRTTCDQVECSAQQTAASLGDFTSFALELARFLNRRVQTRESCQSLGIFETGDIAGLCHDRHRRQSADTGNRLKKDNLFGQCWIVALLILKNKLVDAFEQVLHLLVPGPGTSEFPS